MLARRWSIGLGVCGVIGGIAVFAATRPRTIETRTLDTMQGWVIARGPDSKSGLGVDAVRAALASDARVDVDRFDVQVRDGIVELRGTVPYLAMVDAATDSARRVPGVRAVIDATEVERTDRSDERVRRDVVLVLRRDPALDVSRLSVRVNDGRVFVRARARTFGDRRRAERLARSVRGARDVVSAITVERQERSDAAIEAALARRLQREATIEPWLLEIGVTDGVVTLRGVQSSALGKERAIEAAWQAGARDVITTLLEVDPALDEARRRAPYGEPSDSELVRAVSEALAEEPRLRDSRFTVVAHDGIVALEGYVRCLEARARAEAAASHVRGVRSIDNRLRVATRELRHDEDLHREAMQLLARSGTIDGPIAIRVERGVVTLTGRVGSPCTRAFADELVQRIEGVRAIENALEVG